jgi:triacylglycerol lipase
MSDDDRMGVISRALGRPETYAGWMREVAGTVAFAARYPFGVIEAGFAARHPTDVVHDTPVVLVHGYGHNRSGWFLIERHLRAAGFNNLATLNYNPLALDVPRIAGRLADRIEAVRHHSGAEQVHIVGHSLGGIVLRWYIQELGGDRVVDTAVTIASPHRGTVAALVPFGRTASQLRPDSWVMNRLAATARPMPVRWIAYYTNLDVLVQPATSAMITHPALAARNVLVKDEGHLSVLLSPVVARSIATELASRSIARSEAG